MEFDVRNRKQTIVNFREQIHKRRHSGFETPGFDIAVMTLIHDDHRAEFSAYRRPAFSKLNPWIDGNGDGSIRNVTLTEKEFIKRYQEHKGSAADTLLFKWLGQSLGLQDDQYSYHFLPGTKRFVVGLGDVVVEINLRMTSRHHQTTVVL
jgi:hypothetical protein